MLLVSSDVNELEEGLEEGLVEDLDGMARWVEANKLKLNVQKCECDVNVNVRELESIQEETKNKRNPELLAKWHKT